MNKGFIKFITDFGPLLIFFIFYYQSGLNLRVAIPPLIIATLLSLAIIYLLEKKVAFMPLASGIVITFFGGLTLYFDNPVFIYVKPTVVNILFALVLIFGKFFSKEPLLKKLFKNSFKLLDEGWNKFNDRWILFFFFLAILNEIVWRTQSEEFWVNFKVWGLLPISFLFTVSQIPLIKKYQIKK
ncbi:MAG: septation protein A [Pelagibacteraceae bacterium]|jgi:intracellular septation protein|nr:septation protein A [Pelagibacteraceae bacterium]